MEIRNGSSLNRKRLGDGRPTLSIDHPRTKNSLAALDLSNCNVGEVRRFSNWLHGEAQAFERERPRYERGRISKYDAARIIAIELAKLHGRGGCE